MYDIMHSNEKRLSYHFPGGFFTISAVFSEFFETYSVIWYNSLETPWRKSQSALQSNKHPSITLKGRNKTEDGALRHTTLKGCRVRKDARRWNSQNRFSIWNVIGIARFFWKCTFKQNVDDLLSFTSKHIFHTSKFSDFSLYWWLKIKGKL